MTATTRTTLGWLTAAAVCIGVGVGAAVSGRSVTRLLTRGAGPAPASPAPPAARDVPLAFAPTVSLRDDLDAASTTRAVERLRIDRPYCVSTAVHYMRLFGPDARCVATADPRSGALARDAVLDHAESARQFGEPTLVETRSGVRCFVQEARNAERQPAREAHATQLLAGLGESGVPLSTPVTVLGGSARQVRAILDDAVASYDPDQAEIEWTATAFALYLPPQRSWANKFGRVYSFDDLARELLRRPLSDQRACGGTHLLYALTILMRADAVDPVLGPETRAEVAAHLGRMAHAARGTQSPDGTWDPDWYDEAGRKTAAAHARHVPDVQKVLITGHQIEWLMLLPRPARPPKDVFLSAARWLQVRLLVDSPHGAGKEYCPYSHAGRVLDRLRAVGADE